MFVCTKCGKESEIVVGITNNSKNNLIFVTACCLAPYSVVINQDESVRQIFDKMKNEIIEVIYPETAEYKCPEIIIKITDFILIKLAEYEQRLQKLEK